MRRQFIIAALLGSLLIGVPVRLDGQASKSEPLRVAVLTSPITGTDDEAALRAACADLFTRELNHYPSVVVVSNAAVEAGKRHANVQDPASAEPVKVAELDKFVGDVSVLFEAKREGDKARLQVARFDRAAGKPEPPSVVICQPEEIPAKVEEMADKVVKNLSLPDERKLPGNDHQPSPQAFEWYGKGVLYVGKQSEQDNKQAISSFQKAIEADAQWPLPMMSLAVAYLQQVNLTGRDKGRLGEAHRSLDRAEKLNPDPVELHTLRAGVFALQNKADEAIASAKKALELKPNDPYAHNVLAEAYLRKGGGREPSLKQAASELKEVVRLDPQTPEFHFNYGKVLLELAKMQVSNAKQQYAQEAAREFKKVIELRPDAVNSKRFLQECERLMR